MTWEKFKTRLKKHEIILMKKNGGSFGLGRKSLGFVTDLDFGFGCRYQNQVSVVHYFHIQTIHQWES